MKNSIYCPGCEDTKGFDEEKFVQRYTAEKETNFSESKQRKLFGKMVQEKMQKMGITEEQLKLYGLSQTIVAQYIAGNPITQEYYKNAIASMLDISTEDISVKRKKE